MSDRKVWFPPPVDYVEGKRATRKSHPGVACFCCGEAGGVVYLGTEVHEGSLELCHLIHTEITNWFECTRCGGEWRNDRMI